MKQIIEQLHGPLNVVVSCRSSHFTTRVPRLRAESSFQIAPLPPQPPFAFSRQGGGDLRPEPGPPSWRRAGPVSGVAKGVPGPRSPQLFEQFWSPWGPLGLVRGALDAVGASLELLGTPWARDTFSNTRSPVPLSTPSQRVKQINQSIKQAITQSIN